MSMRLLNERSRPLCANSGQGSGFASVCLREVLRTQSVPRYVPCGNKLALH